MTDLVGFRRLLAAIALLLTISACGSSSDESAEDSSETTAEIPSPPLTFPRLDCNKAGLGCFREWNRQRDGLDVPDGYWETVDWQRLIGQSDVSLEWHDTSDAFNGCVSGAEDGNRLCLPRLTPRRVCSPLPVSPPAFVGVLTGSKLARDAVTAATAESDNEAAAGVMVSRFCDFLERSEEETSRWAHRTELDLSDDDLARSISELESALDDLDPGRVKLTAAQLDELDQQTRIILTSTNASTMRPLRALTCRFRKVLKLPAPICS